MPQPNTAKTLAAKATYFPRPQQKCVSVFWTCIVHNTNTNKEAPRRIETFWRFKTEAFDATTEALEALVKPYEKVVMLTDYWVSNEDRVMLNDLDMKLPQARKK
jgi:hypothetical protein